MLPINPILAAAAANILVGVAIYSKYTFGPLWAKVSGKKVSGLKDMPVRFAIEAVSSIMTATALYIAILTFKKAEIVSDTNMFTHMYAWFFQDIQTDMMSSLKIAGFLWLGFMVPHVLCHVAWDESMNWRKGALKAVFSLVHILAMAAAIAYFA
jgi:hypothetical protein